MARPRGLNTLQTCHMAVRPIRRTIETITEDPPTYWHTERTWDMRPNYPRTWELETEPPEPLGDVSVTLTARGPFINCSSGVIVAFDYWWSDRIGEAWQCECPTPCGPDCDDGSPVTFVVPRLTWINLFANALYFDVTFDWDGECTAEGGEYLKVEIDYLQDTGVTSNRTEDEDFVPYHGWATIHNTLCGNQEGVLSKAVGQWRIDPHNGLLVCYHEVYDHYSQNGLTGLNLAVPDDDVSNEGELCHGAVLQQRIDGMVLRMWSDPACDWV